MAGTVQAIIGGGQGGMASNTYFSGLWGGYWESIDDRHCSAIVPHSLTLQNFKVTLSAAPGVGKTRTFTIRRNKVATDITLDIAHPATTGEDVTHTQACVAGDRIDIVQTDDGAAGCTPNWYIEADPDTADQYWIGGNLRASTAVNKVSAFGSCGNDGGGSTIEERYLAPSPVAGSLKNLHVEMEADPGTAPNGYIYTVRIDEADTALTCTIIADDKTGNDVAHSVALAQGDLLSFGCWRQGTPTVQPYVWWGCTLALDAGNSGESPHFASTQGDKPATAADEFYPPVGNFKSTWQAAEAPNYGLAPAGTIKNLFVYANTAPGADKSSDFTLRINGSDSNVTAQLTGAAPGGQTGNSGGLSDTTVDGDLLSMESHPTGTPLTDDIGFGWVFTPPAAPGPENIAEVNGVVAANIAELNGVAWADIAEVNEVP